MCGETGKNIISFLSLCHSSSIPPPLRPSAIVVFHEHCFSLFFVFPTLFCAIYFKIDFFTFDRSKGVFFDQSQVFKIMFFPYEYDNHCRVTYLPLSVRAFPHDLILKVNYVMKEFHCRHRHPFVESVFRNPYWMMYHRCVQYDRKLLMEINIVH